MKRDVPVVGAPVLVVVEKLGKDAGDVLELGLGGSRRGEYGDAPDLNVLGKGWKRGVGGRWGRHNEINDIAVSAEVEQQEQEQSEKARIRSY